MRAPDGMSARAGGAARALMQRVLGGGDDLARESPLAFDERFEGEIVALEEAGAVRSACAILPRDFVCGGATVRIGLIGSVATDPAWRRRGLMTRLLDLAEARLAERGCALALLWAEEPAVYASRGYVPIGHEVDYWADPPLFAGLPASARVRPAEAADAASIHALYENHAQRVCRTGAETRALLACPAMDVLVLCDAAGAPRAYACAGRGRDLANVVHEWSGAPDDVLALVGAHQRARLARGLEPDLVLMAPSEAAPLHALLGALGARRFDGILGLAKPLDPHWLAERLAHSAQVPLAIGVARGLDGERALCYASPSGRRELALSAVLQALFPPGGDLGAYHYVTDALRTQLRGAPLRPFAWGLDSI